MRYKKNHFLFSALPHAKCVTIITLLSSIPKNIQTHTHLLLHSF